MKTKEAENKEMPKESAVLEPYNLFEKFIDHDKPKGLNKPLLISLNKKVIDEAFDLEKDDQ
jgi:hypothetical protein